MRKLLTLTIASLAVAGCVYGPMPQQPGQQPGVTPPPPTEQVTPAMRTAARQVVNREMAKRLPGVNVSPYTDCVIQNANTDDIIDLASMSAGDSSGAPGKVAAIVQRPSTTQCISAAARAA